MLNKLKFFKGRLTKTTYIKWQIPFLSPIWTSYSLEAASLACQVQKIPSSQNGFIYIYMGGFAQFGLNQFKRGQKRFSQHQLSLEMNYP